MFLRLVKDSQSLNNVPTRFKQPIHAVDTHANYSVMTCNMTIPSVANTMEKSLLPNSGQLCKSNMCKSDYERKIKKGIYKHTLKRELDRRMNQ